MPAPIIIERLHESTLMGRNDETFLVPRKSFVDATKHRLGAWLRHPFGWLGGYSFNIFDGDEDDPVQYEKVLVGVRHDDDFPKDVEAFEFVVMGHYPGERGDMGRRHEWLRVTSQYVEAFGQRIATNGGDAFAAGVTELYRTLLFRDPEPGVIETWRASTGGNLDIVRQAILGSEEYQGTHP